VVSFQHYSEVVVEQLCLSQHLHQRLHRQQKQTQRLKLKQHQKLNAED
jgi:hypothetical protein